VTTTPEATPEAPDGAHAGGGAPGAAIKISLTKVMPVYLATWQNDKDTCAIDRSPFTSPRVNHEVMEATEPCGYVEGNCGHMFHPCCIERWIQRDRACPLCATDLTHEKCGHCFSKA
jgi:hypothetical protein